MYTVYFIENKVNYKGYVGVTSWEIEDRLQEHIYTARSGKDTVLYHALRKYGSNKFRIFSIEKHKKKEKAFEREKHWISILDTFESSEYNASPGGCGRIDLFGEDSPASKITASDVLEIRKTLSGNTDIIYSDLAEKYPVSETTIGNIQRNESWAHLDSFENSESRKHPNLKLNEQTVERARKRHYDNEDLTVNDLAKKYDVSYSAMAAALRGETWQHAKGPTRTNKHNGSSLDEKQVKEIRRRYEEENISQSDLAGDYPCARSTVGSIVRRETWTEI